MGNYFLMSKRFNKCSPEDFGLIFNEKNNAFLKKEDNTVWKSRLLYDYGWGRETGFYRVPMPDFNKLVEIILESKDEEDKYGAAAVILDDYCDQLLEKCLEILKENKSLKSYFNFFEILDLKNPINRSTTLDKNESQVSQDFEKWKAIAKAVSNI